MSKNDISHKNIMRVGTQVLSQHDHILVLNKSVSCRIDIQVYNQIWTRVDFNHGSRF